MALAIATGVVKAGKQWKSKGLALLIEHAPCCLLSLLSGLIGIHALNHNPLLEFGFAVGGAIVGEYIGHRYFHGAAEAATGTHVPHFRRHDTLKRYGLALAIGLFTWGLHQQFFHGHHDSSRAAVVQSAVMVA